MDPYLRPAETFIEGSRTLPGKYYTSDEVYREELEKIFYDAWICAGRANQVPEPGDYILREIGEESIIIVRDRKGKINAYYNVCRHRGTRLVIEEKGRFSACIQCPYHAWTYDLAGNLIGAPLMDELEGFSKSDYSLHRAAISQWEGFLFVNLAHQPVLLESVFAPVAGKFAAWDLPHLQALRRKEYEVKANWKLIVQNYSECYHCPLIHPDLARRSPYRSGKNDLYEGPFLGGYMEIKEDFGSLTMSGRACGLPIGEVSGEDLERVYYYSIFPNMLLSLHPDYVMAHTLWPQSPDRTHIICEWLFSKDQMEQGGFNPDDAAEFWDMTNRQDWQVCELSQLGVRSRMYSPSPYSGVESLLAAFDRQVLKALQHDYQDQSSWKPGASGKIGENNDQN